MRNDVETRRTCKSYDRDGRCIRVSNTELRVYGEREPVVCLIRDIIILIPRADRRTDAPPSVVQCRVLREDLINRIPEFTTR